MRQESAWPSATHGLWSPVLCKIRPSLIAAQGPEGSKALQIPGSNIPVEAGQFQGTYQGLDIEDMEAGFYSLSTRRTEAPLTRYLSMAFADDGYSIIAGFVAFMQGVTPYMANEDLSASYNTLFQYCLRGHLHPRVM